MDEMVEYDGRGKKLVVDGGVKQGEFGKANVFNERVELE